MPNVQATVDGFLVQVSYEGRVALEILVRGDTQKRCQLDWRDDVCVPYEHQDTVRQAGLALVRRTWDNVL